MSGPRLRRALPLFRGVELPRGHSPGLRVPRGGSSCASCRYGDARTNTCREPNFIRWNGGPDLPADAREYCSDWWTPRRR
jgi:hypothetical protein